MSAEGAASVTTSATLIVPANRNRTAVEIYNNHTAEIFRGVTSALTTANGIPLDSKSSVVITGDGTEYQWFYRGDIYGIVASGTADVRYIEYTVS